jgi:hypothetical protein
LRRLLPVLMVSLKNLPDPGESVAVAGFTEGNMGFISVLKKIGHGAEVAGKDALEVAGPALSAAAAIDPALAPVAALVSGIARSVLAAAPAYPAAQAAAKDQVLMAIEAISPAFLELLLDHTGHEVTDTARFQTGVDQVIEGILDIYKSFGAVPSSTAPVAPVPGA